MKRTCEWFSREAGSGAFIVDAGILIALAALACLVIRVGW